MRKNPTDAEAILWNILRGKRLEGMRFRRQHPIETYIVDFICLEEKLIIEVDGSQHANNVYDEKRDAMLKQSGFTVLRFWNDEIIQNSDDMAQMILKSCGQATHVTPPPVHYVHQPPRKGEVVQAFSHAPSMKPAWAVRVARATAPTVGPPAPRKARSG
ncbi:hypothetical protein GQR58_004423 [Nymphon striatum]|nr:hypothetical protein GQR58_004423 [Nymphon striatum]